MSASKGNYDIYVVFVEKGLSLLNSEGTLGFILPHKFFNSQYGESLRGIIAKGKHLSQVVHFGHQQVFENATTYTCLVFLAGTAKPQVRFSKVGNLDDWRLNDKAEQGWIPSDRVSAADWDFGIGAGPALLDKLRLSKVKLQDVTSRIFQGIKTSADKVYIVEERSRKNGVVTVYSPQLENEYRLEPDLLHPLVKGGDSKRYALSRTNRLILFPYEDRGGVVDLVPADEIERRFPLTWHYLVANKDYLADREHGKVRGPKWFGYI